MAVTLTAAHGSFRLASGERIDGYTLNGTSPGPEIRATQGDLVEVTLMNESVTDGATLHWHGIDVPNAEDGVAGVTQDAVPVGGTKVYRFLAEDTGTYWYHSHQVSHEQVKQGLFGVIVIEPPAGTEAGLPDVVAAVHAYGGRRTISGRTGTQTVETEPGADQARTHRQHRQQPAAGVGHQQRFPGPRGGRPGRQRTDPRCGTECSS